MSSFLAGLLTGCLVGAVVTLLILLIIAGVKSPGRAADNKVSRIKILVVAICLLAICGACYVYNLEKSALVALVLSVLLIAKVGGSTRGMAAAGLGAILLAWFLPPRNSLSVTGLDNRLSLALFVIGTVVGSIAVEGNQWLNRWITTSDPDR
jgi:K+-sensing histidine kinase KdpD